MRHSLLFLTLLFVGLCPSYLSANPFYFSANLTNGFGGGAPGNGIAEVDLSSDLSTINVFLSVNLQDNTGFGYVLPGTGIYNGATPLYTLPVNGSITSGLLSGTFAINQGDVAPLQTGQLSFDVLVQVFFAGSRTPPQINTLTFPVGQGLAGLLGSATGPVITPEPASAGLLGLALAGLGAIQLRARRRGAKPKERL